MFGIFLICVLRKFSEYFPRVSNLTGLVLQKCAKLQNLFCDFDITMKIYVTLIIFNVTMQGMQVCNYNRFYHVSQIN